MPSETGLRCAFTAVLGVALLASCGCQDPTAKPTHPKFPERYRQLPRLQQTADTELQKELARLRSERALPDHLAGEGPFFSELVRAAAQNRAIGPKATPAERFARAFTRGEVDAALRYFRDGIPRPLPPEPATLRKLLRFRKRFEANRRQARAALAAFPVEPAEPALRYEHHRGLYASAALCDYARATAQLEVAMAVEMVARNRPEPAWEAIVATLRVARILGRMKHTNPRILAVHIRHDALDVLDYAIRAECLQRTHLARALQTLHAELDAWPPDAWAWIGERAEALHTYELIRDGYLLSVLSPQELERIEQTDGLQIASKRVIENLDGDQRFYLHVLRRCILASTQPYHERMPLFRQIDVEIRRLRGSAGYPQVADMVLLPHLQTGQRLQAADRARCEAWALALAAALEQPARDYKQNPLTGSAYRLQRRDGWVRVFGVHAPEDEPIGVRLPGTAAPRVSRRAP